MKKRIIGFILLIAIVLSFSTASASAETVKLMLYDEAFDCSYTKESGSIVVDEQVDNGDGTKSFSIVAGWGWHRGIELVLDKAQDLRYRNASIHFRVKQSRESSSASLRIDIKNSSQNIYYLPAVTTEWKEYELPLTSFLKFNDYDGGFDLSEVKSIKLGVMHDGASLVYYFDDVYLIMDAAETEDTYTPDVNIYEEGLEGLSFGAYASETSEESYSGTKSVKMDLTLKDGENKYWLNNGRCVNKTVELTEDVARYGYISFKYKCVTENAANIVIQFQRYIPQTGSWAMTKGSYTLYPVNGWKEVNIPIADLLADELDTIYEAGNTVKFISLYTIGNGFLGQMYLDEIGIFYPGVSAKLYINGKRSDYIASGNAEVNVNVRGSFGDSYDVYLCEFEEGRLKSARVMPCESGSVGEKKYTFAYEGLSASSLKAMAWKKDGKPLAEADEIGKAPVKVEYYYPDFREKALTFSCDDGAYASDVIFIDLLKKYNLKATFNIVGKWMNNNSTWYTSEAQKGIYDGFEVASHGYTHGQWASFANDDAAKNDLKTNWDYLTNLFGKVPQGFAWPYGDPNNAVLSRYVKELGAEYARPADSVTNYYFPSDWYSWKQKFCSVDNVNSYGYDFFKLKYDGTPLVCTFWMHSSEWNTAGKFISGGTAKQQWDVLEGFMKKASEDETIWAATNIEIVRYAKALERVVVTENSIQNPSELDVYLGVNGEKIKIKAMDTYLLP